MVDETPNPESPSVSQLLGEIDAEREVGRPSGSKPEAPVPFRRLRRVASSAAPTTDPSPGTAPAPDGAGTATHVGGAAVPYSQWLREKQEKYARLLRCRSTDDFIDITLLNTVMAEYGGTYCEVVREAREHQDAAEDLKEAFDFWWDAKVAEARDLAVTQGKKFTSDSGLQQFARAMFAAEYQQRHEPVKEAARKAEFMGSLKAVVANCATVLKAAGPNFAFEYTTAGGLKFDGDGNTYFGLTARRIGDRPPPHALMDASKRRSGAAPTG